jgi:hypothetical protein
MTQNTYRIAEEYNEAMRCTVFYVWDDIRLLGAYQTRHEAQEFIKKSANHLTTRCDQAR